MLSRVCNETHFQLRRARTLTHTFGDFYPFATSKKHAYTIVFSTTSRTAKNTHTHTTRFAMDGMTHIKNIYKLRNRLYARRGVSAESAGLLLFAAARRQNIVRYDIAETAAVVAAAARRLTSII